jgi:hypothetical protein
MYIIKRQSNTGGGRNVKFQNYDWPFFQNVEMVFLVDQNIEIQEDQNIESDLPMAFCLLNLT